MTRYDLTDLEWRATKPLPLHKPRCVPRVGGRRPLIADHALSTLGTGGL